MRASCCEGRKQHLSQNDYGLLWAIYTLQEWLSETVPLSDSAVILAEKVWEQELIPDVVDMDDTAFLETTAQEDEAMEAL